MPHPRQVIRERFRDTLLDVTAAGKNVETTRVTALREVQDLPFIAVHTPDDVVRPSSLNSSPRVLVRDLTVNVELYVQPPNTWDVDNCIDDLALEIETALHADPFFGDDCILNDSGQADTKTQVIEDAGRLIGFAQLTYNVEYDQPAPAAPTALDLFDTAENTFNLDNDQDAADRAVDLVEDINNES